MKLDVVKDSDKPWYSDGLAFTCTQCGNCCTGAPGYVWMSDVEIDRLAEYLKMDRDEVLKQYCRKIGGKISLKEHRNHRNQYDCTFLKEIDNRRVCTVYPVRPLQCRTWPFWDGNLATEKSWQLAGQRCPGMDQGKKYSQEEIEKLRDATDWPKPKDAPGSGSAEK